MNVVIVNNEKSELMELKNQLISRFPKCNVTEFTDPMVSVKYIVGDSVDIVIADANMKRVNGVQLLKVIRMQKPNQAVIILAENESMRQEAERLAVDGYWLKPITVEKLDEIMTILNSPIKQDTIFNVRNGARR